MIIAGSFSYAQVQQAVVTSVGKFSDDLDPRRLQPGYTMRDAMADFLRRHIHELGWGFDRDLERQLMSNQRLDEDSYENLKPRINRGRREFRKLARNVIWGIREVPLHPAIKDLVKGLVETSEDGYLLSGLTMNKYDDRSNAIGKRFGRMKTKLGFGRSHVFHSIRKTVVTLMENAGVSENIAADVVGHDKPRITYGLYSGGSELAIKSEALSKVAYPAEQLAAGVPDHSTQANQNNPLNEKTKPRTGALKVAGPTAERNRPKGKQLKSVQ